MLERILNMFGVEGLVWTRATSPGLIIFMLVAIVILTVFLYRKGRGMPTGIRAGLAVARLIALLVLLAMIFEPMASFRRSRKVKPRLAVLVDVSQSMSIKDQRKRVEDVVDAAWALGLIPDSALEDINGAATSLSTKQREAVTDASRVDLAAGLLGQSARPIFRALAESVEIDYYVFGSKLRLLGADGDLALNALGDLMAQDTETSIADSLGSVVSSNRGEPLAGIVLLSDGLDTSSRRAESILRDLGVQGIPVYTIPMGIADPDDVSIRNVIMQEVAFTGDKVPIRVQIHSKGYEKRNATLTVKLNNRRVEQQSIKLAGGLQYEDVFFHVDINERGAARVTISIEPFIDEATAQNNVVERSVQVVNQKIKVLCIEGSPRWEYRYLRAMLKRDPRIETTFIATYSGPGIAQNSSEYIAKFPERREEAFKYDLIILGDVNRSFFQGQEFDRIEELVKERGGSLLMLCGARYSPTSYGGTPIEKMLPVSFVANGEWEDVDETVYPVLTPEGRSSLVMTLEHDQELNDNVWSRVAPLYVLPPLLRARPGATVLTTLSNSTSSEDQYPLVAWQRYGSGKCMSIASDRLWLLRFKTGDKYHWRVWSQCIQFLTLSRLMGENKRTRLETDRSMYPTDGQVQVYAHLLDKRYDPVMQAQFDVRVVPLKVPGATEQIVTLRPDAGRPGMFEGFFSPIHAGRYRVLSATGDSELANTVEFQVADFDPELADTTMQIARLRRISELSGGTSIPIRQVNNLPSLIDTEPKTVSYSVELSLWDKWWVLFPLILLMGAEWIVRRRYDLS